MGVDFNTSMLDKATKGYLQEQAIKELPLNMLVDIDEFSKEHLSV